MAKSIIPSKNTDIVCGEQTEMTLIERVIVLGAPDKLEERQRVEITLDKLCRRDPAAEVLHADRIRHHTLIDDNPTSG